MINPILDKPSLLITNVIKYELLKQIKKNSFWLINNMKKNHLELENVFYAFYMNQETYFIKKNWHIYSKII